MLIKTTVDFMTENGERTMTFHTNPQGFDKTFSAMQNLTDEKKEYIALDEYNFMEPINYSISLGEVADKPNLTANIISFLCAAGVHPTILKATQMGTVFVLGANISVV